MAVAAVLPGRRTATPRPAPVRALALGLSLIVLLALGAAVVRRLAPREIPLADHVVAIGPDGRVVELPAGAGTVVPGTRVLAGPGSASAVAAEQAWLAAGSVPVVPELGDSDLVRGALLDLRLLSADDGVPVAAWSGPWRYVWPRDAAFAAVALARTGHLDDADRILDFLGRVQPPSGVFQARYLPDGSGVPDDRGTQLDGSGWALWATAEVADALPPADRAIFATRHRQLVERSTAAALNAIDNPRHLPPPSPDYWEVPVRRTSLATAAPLLAGLEAAGRLAALTGDDGAEQRATVGAAQLRSAIDVTFAAHGYPRLAGGSAQSVDLGLAFLLPPYATSVDDRAASRLRTAGGLLARPAGGLAPGGSWPRDGVSWTPATAVWALACAGSGDRDESVRLLRWLTDHRTADGALPEKVLADGRPAEVAPLAWTAATVVLAADRLARPAG